MIGVTPQQRNKSLYSEVCRDHEGQIRKKHRIKFFIIAKYLGYKGNLNLVSELEVVFP